MRRHRRSSSILKLFGMLGSADASVGKSIIRGTPVRRGIMRLGGAAGAGLGWGLGGGSARDRSPRGAQRRAGAARAGARRREEQPHNRSVVIGSPHD